MQMIGSANDYLIGVSHTHTVGQCGDEKSGWYLCIHITLSKQLSGYQGPAPVQMIEINDEKNKRSLSWG